MTAPNAATTDIRYDIEDVDTWRELAACARRPDIDFFPAGEDVAAAEVAKAVCASCPVVDECLGFAMETNQPDGIWGGMTATERAKIRRRWMQEVLQAS